MEGNSEVRLGGRGEKAQERMEKGEERTIFHSQGANFLRSVILSTAKASLRGGGIRKHGKIDRFLLGGSSTLKGI